MQKDGEPKATREILSNLPKASDAMTAMIRQLMVGMRSTAPSSELTGGASVTLKDVAKIIQKASEEMEPEE